MVKTVLIVDDRVVNIEFLGMLLGYVGYRVIKATQGAEALDLARVERPALIITDIVMPVMNGPELVKRLQADATMKHIPVIFYTAKYSAREVHLAVDTFSVAAVLIKPAEPEKILQLVESLIGAALNSPQNSPLSPVRMPDAAQEPTRPVPAVKIFPTLNLRLAALLELTITLSAERDLQRLLSQFCVSAQNIMNVGSTAVGVEGCAGVRLSASCNMPDSEVQAIFNIVKSDAGLLRQRFDSGDLFDAADVGADPAMQQLGPLHPLLRKFIMIPINCCAGSQGWVYLASKLGGAEFSAEDREFATTLAIQLAPLYENLSLYAEAKLHVKRLEVASLQRQLVEDKLQHSEAGLRRAQIMTKSAHFILKEDGAFDSWSKTLPQLAGVTEACMPQTLQSWMDLVSPADQAKFAEVASAADRTRTRMGVEYQVKRRSDGATVDLHHEFEPLRSLNDSVTENRWFHTVQDVTEQKGQQQKIVRLNRFFAVLSSINSAVVRIHDRSALFQEVCRVAVNEGAFAMAWICTIDPDTLEKRVTVCERSERGPAEKIRCATGAWLPDPDGPWSIAAREQRPFLCNDIEMETTPILQRGELLKHGCRSLAAFPLIMENQTLAVMTLFADEVGAFDDEEFKLLNEWVGDLLFGLRLIDKEEKLSYQAYHDVLTGLPNSTLFKDRLAQHLLASTSRTCVILIDLDHFSELNDLMGRHVGDAVLMQVAQRLRTHLSRPCSVARIGGDIFAILVPDLQMAEALLEQEIFEVFAAAFVVDQKDIRVTARGGLALAPEDGLDAETLFKHAEVALKQAKSSVERFLYYASQMNAALAARTALSSELQVALDTRQFLVHYQPRVDLLSGRIVSAEALIRWHHPQRGMVPPDQFIPMAEETELIVPIGAWVIDTVCAQQAAWLAQGVAIVPVAVNLSAVQFNKGAVLQTIHDAIKRHGLEARYIEFELTESVVMSDPEKAIGHLQSLKKIGIKLALDDFGTGYSSLAYLKHLPFDFVKIDRAFITDITKSSRDAMIATAVIAIGHSLDLRVVAEGVETEEQLDYLRQHRCDEIQGYYFSRPLPTGGFEAMLREDKRLVWGREPAASEVAALN